MSGKRRRLSGTLKKVLDEAEEPIIKRSKQKEMILNDLDSNEKKDLINKRFANRLGDDFFNNNCISLSRELLGKYLIRKIITADSEIRLLVGKIVETEAYLGAEDKASHSYGNKKTERTNAMFMSAGTCYVYNIYGIYCCMNISSQESGAAVLIRALEPISGFDLMKVNRTNKKQSKSTRKMKPKDLTSGPSKLCMALKIDKNFNEIDLSSSDDIWLQSSIELKDVKEAPSSKIVSAKRIGIDYAGEEAVDKLYRFYLKDNNYVSLKSKIETFN